MYLSNGRALDYVIASGAMGFDAKGWFWERPLVWIGRLRPELFTTFIRTLTKHPRPYPISNLSWVRPWTWLPFSPWSCVRLIEGGSVNKIGLWNPGIEYWHRHIAPTIDFQKYSVGGSIYGNEDELVSMAETMNQHDLTALELNDSCPNTGHSLCNVEMVIANAKRVKEVSRHPIIVKVSVAQNYLAIAEGLQGIAEAISLNSVPWETVFPEGVKKSPLWRLEQKVGGGGGGVSGKIAQQENWKAVCLLAEQGLVPVIASSIMEFEDMDYVTKILGAKAVSFGAIHLPDYPFWRKPWTLLTNPCKPTSFVIRRFQSRTF